jgi:prepilin-type N-terminal cleavage/methylation domain-containing protein
MMRRMGSMTRMTGRVLTNERGITLVEMLIVASIIAILAVAMGFSFQGWIGRYRVESESKELYSDMMNARTRAMARSRLHCVNITNTPSGAALSSYMVREDMSGDGTCDTDVAGYPKVTRHLLLAVPAISQVDFNRNGLVNAVAAVRFDAPDVEDVDYDCISLERTRINMGAWDGTDCIQK